MRGAIRGRTIPRRAIGPSVAVAVAGILLSGCVQRPYAPPPPIELQPYAPPLTYRTAPPYRAPFPSPLSDPLPAPVPFGEPPAAGLSPNDDNGPIPLQQMPAPSPDVAPRQTATPELPSATPPETVRSPAPSPARTPTAGPGSNVPLEGFRPMHSQTRPTP